MTDMTSDLELRQAALRTCVRHVYQAFGSYRLARYIEPDGCFPDACDDRPLRADSLSQLPAAAFDRYQGKAITTWGSVDDFKRFLPRMLELIAFPNADARPMPLKYGFPYTVDGYSVFGKLEYGQWRRWRKAERNALDGYFDALWSFSLAMPVKLESGRYEQASLSGLLSDFSLAHEDVTRFLKHWDAEAADPTSGLTAAAHLAASVVCHRDSLLELDSPTGRQDNQQLAWLASDDVAKLLESAFFRWSETPYADLISQAHDWLGWIRRRRADQQ